jgi:hypothetical protein
MAGSGNTLEEVGRHLALAVRPLRDAVVDLDSFRVFMFRLGWGVDSLPASFEALGAKVDAVLASLDQLQDPAEIEQVLELLDHLVALTQAVRNLSEAPAGVDGSEFLAEIGERLLELLLVDYLVAALPTVYNALAALGIIEHESHLETPTRPGFTRARLHLDQLPAVLADPLSVPERVYGWGTPQVDYATLFTQLQDLLLAAGFLARVQLVGGAPSPIPLDERFLAEGEVFHEEFLAESEPAEELLVVAQAAEAYQEGRSKDEDPIEAYLDVLLAEGDVGEVTVEGRFVLLELPAQGGKLPGVILQPVLPPELAPSLDFGESLSLRPRPDSDLASLFGIVIRPGEVSLRYPFKPGEELPPGGFGLQLEFSPEESFLLLGSREGTRMEFGGALGAIDLDHREGAVELVGRLELKDFKVVVSAKDQDGFLRFLLGDKQLTAPIELAVQWSSTRGISFAGGTGFELAFDPHLTLGPVRVDEVQLGLRGEVGSGSAPRLIGAAAASISGGLGPVAFAIQGVGLRATLRFEDGNAGPFDLEVGFQPPTGVGLRIDGAAVSGGGFLAFEEEEERYVGIVQLEIRDKIALQGVGLLTTKLPDGRKGFSLVLSISGRFTPIQLGYGFTLNGVGGLVGVNRTMRVDVLREGIGKGTLDSVLFPEDPVRDANRIVSDLRSVFPVTVGRHVVAPMGILGWGTPTLITAELGLFIELPLPPRIVLLGQVDCLLPSADRALVELHSDVLGVLDLGRGTLAIDATIYDSRLVTYALTGEMALRASLFVDPQLVLAFGGLHPGFPAPPGFPSLARMRVSMGNGKNPRLNLDSYTALTANTLQLGAKLELYAEAKGFNVHGYLGFDVLVVLSPFSFEANVVAGVALRRKKRNLFSVELDFVLSGPTPWRAKGKARFKVFLLKVTFRFDRSWGGASAVVLPKADPLGELLEALRDARNWAGVLPPDTRQTVSLREDPPPAGTLRVHPMGSLEVRQKVLPLDIELTRFGSARTPAPVRFSISRVRLDTEVADDLVPVEDHFAPGQFEELTDAERLSRPSFERMRAGVRAGSSEVDVDEGLPRELEYETVIVDSLRPPRRRFGDLLSDALGRAFVASSASFQSPGARRGPRRFTTPGASARIAVAPEGHVITDSRNLSLREDLVPAAGGGLPAVAARRILASHLASHPDQRGRLQVVPLHETLP